MIKKMSKKVLSSNCSHYYVDELNRCIRCGYQLNTGRITDNAHAYQRGFVAGKLDAFKEIKDRLEYLTQIVDFGTKDEKGNPKGEEYGIRWTVIEEALRTHGEQIEGEYFKVIEMTHSNKLKFVVSDLNRHIKERLTMHRDNLRLWQNGVLTPTEPDEEERTAVMRGLMGAINELEVLQEFLDSVLPPTAKAEGIRTQEL